MAMMLRSLLWLGSSLAVCGQVAQQPQPGTPFCGFRGAEAVDELLDSAVFIWAAANRCGKPGEAVKCEIDISSAVESLNGMANVILGALESCGALAASTDLSCGRAVSELTQGVAGLASVTGGILQHCANYTGSSSDKHSSSDSSSSGGSSHRRLTDDSSSTTHAPSTVLPKSNFTIGTCVVDMKDSFKNLFEAIEKTMTIKESCDASKNECITNSLEIVGAMSALGEYISGSVGRCSVGNVPGAECAGEVMGVVHSLDQIGAAGHKMSQFCKMSPQIAHALFAQEGPVAPNKTLQFVAFALMAVLPISAALSFFAGSRSARSGPGAVVRELEALVETQEEGKSDLEDVQVQ